MHARAGVPLAPLTTLRVGGPAASMVDLDREEQLPDALADAESRGHGVFVLGSGSNVVVGDAGFQGLVIRMATRGVDVRSDGDRVLLDVAAGEDWDALVARAIAEGWTGVSSMSGIPGLVGATPIQNVGAYGQEVSDTIVSVRVYDREARAFVDMEPPACRFGYRASLFKRSDRWIVTRVRFAFRRSREDDVRYAELSRALSVPEGSRAPAEAIRSTILGLRRAKGMVLDAADPESVSAGSFFVNPVVDAATLARVESIAGKTPPRFDAGQGRWKLAAAWLVEQAGFARGWTLGRAGISRKHALAIVNRGGASSGEILSAARTVRDGVRARFSVTLEPEPVLVGCSWEDGGL
ncbi:MAG TPA: UDP-N-acetylmuramate dehydrogenase [Polyangiaceae bacterium]